MSIAAPSLTSHLLSLSTVRPYSAATEHAFLVRAGNGTLSKDTLGLYLSQDRLYAAHGYVTYLGHLLAKVPFSSSRPFNSPYEKFLHRIVRIIEYSLQNVIREVNFFNDTATRFGLDIDGWKERKGTRDYLAEMTRVGASGTIEDGIVFLWAMERVRTNCLIGYHYSLFMILAQVYLDSWKYVASLTSPEEDPTPVQKAVAFLVSNWTNEEFIGFVSDLDSIVNQYVDYPSLFRTQYA